MEEVKRLYVYEGIVKEFDNIISRNWKGSTYAVSEKKSEK